MRKTCSSPPRGPGSGPRRSGIGLLAFAAWLLLAAPSAVAGNAETSPSPVPVADDAESFIRDTADRVLTAYSGELADKRRAEIFREILTDTFALKTIARFTLGRYWRIASADQRKEYRRLFEDFLVLAYANRFSDLGGVKLRIASVREINERDSLVLSEMSTAAGKPPVRVAWRVRQTKQGPRIVDVIVDGISMSVTQRDQFAAAIRSAGGKVEGLLAMLREKTGTAE